MPLFGRKKTEDAPVRPAWDPLPLPPPARPDGLRTMEDHRAYLLSCVDELPAFGQQLLDAVDLASCEEIVSPISLPGLRQHRDGRVRRPRPGRGHGVAGRPRTAAGRRRGPGRSGRPAPAVTGHRDEDHDGRTDPGGRRRHRGLRVHRPRRGGRGDLPSERGRAAHPADRRGCRRRSAGVQSGRPARSARHRSAGRHRPGLGAGATASPGGGDRHRLGAGGSRSAAAERLPDLRLELLPAGRRGAGGRRPGVPGGSGQRRSRAGPRADQRSAGPRRSHPHHRWGEPG